MFADTEMEFVLWDWDDASPDFRDGYGAPLDPSPEGAFRRRFYKLYLAMFCTWAYRIQIWKPEEYESCNSWMRASLDEALSGESP